MNTPPGISASASSQPSDARPGDGAPDGAGPGAARSGVEKLSPFLLASIALLVAVTIGAVVLLFVGTFEHRFSRVFATLIVFVVFTALTGLDTSRTMAQRKYYTPFALFANVYALALALVVIWVRDRSVTVIFVDFVGITVYVFVLGRVALLGSSILLKSYRYGRRLLFGTALIATALLSVSAVLFTIPTALWAFHVTTPDMYWRITVALLIITALAIAVTSLLYWSISADERARRAERANGQAPHPLVSPPPGPADWPPPAAPSPYQQSPYQQGPYQQGPQQTPYQQGPHQATYQQGQYRSGPHQPPQQQASPQPVPLQQVQGQPRPWPVFPDGRPVPALGDGRPDFDALRRAVEGEG